jgi:hypothetical protein
MQTYSKNATLKGGLRSPDEAGAFDYLDGTISLYKYNKVDRRLLKNAISFRTNVGIMDPELSNAIGLIAHEVTHYLDQTTTLWGIEFLFRRNRAMEKFLSEETEPREVFLLNACEILMHKDLVRVHRNIELENVSLSHVIWYSEKYGPLILIEIKKDGLLIAQTPLSMLSLLEANAISNETLAHIKIAICAMGHLSDFHQNRISSKLDSVLKDPDRLEYNILHILVKVHFKELNISSRLLLISALVDFSLNISSLDLAALANTFSESIVNKKFGDALCNDLCRGMSRQVVAFKLILFIYEYTQYACIEPSRLESYIIDNFDGLLKDTLDYFGRVLPCHENEFNFSNLEFSYCIKLLRSVKGKIEPKNHISRMLNNRRIRKANLSVSCHLGKYYLPDLILNDYSQVKFRSRQRYKINKLKKANRDEVEHIYRLINNTSNIYKFHMVPSAIGPMQLNKIYNYPLSQEE